MPAALRDRFAALVRRLQDDYITRFEQIDGGARFRRDEWQRPGGGGGVTAALEEGALFERGGCNVSVVHGEMPEPVAARLARAGRAHTAGDGAPGGGGGAQPFFAAGLSVILHPRSPMVPTVHMNVRYLEVGDDAWFGGGADLTPWYLFEDDARHFHRVLKDVCERHPCADYARFKQDCDRYFHIAHRGEGRGVGGIFFDDQREPQEGLFELVADFGGAFPGAYLPVVERRKDEPWGDAERHWQCVRRGRYVEFNLVYDRGTRFGLETAGRIESILVSMPPLVRWRYSHEPKPGSREAALVAILREPRDWLGEEAAEGSTGR